RDQGVAELLGFLEKFRQSSEGGLEHPALLPRADHIDVEAGERTRVMLGERLAQRRACAHAAQHMGRDGTEPWVGRQLFLDGERAVEGEARLEERGQLLGEGDELTAPDATLSQGGPGEA